MEQILIDDYYIDSDLINHKGQKYPRIVIQDSAIVKPSIAPEHLAGDIFLEDDKNFFRKLFQHYCSQGFISMLNFIKDCHNKQQQSSENVDHLKGYDKVIGDDRAQHIRINYGLKILYVLATILLYIHFLYLTIHFYFYPFDKYSDDELLRKFNPNPEWKSGVVRSFVWHTNSLRCALALINDLIYVYTADIHRSMNHIICLKNPQQRQITAMCWHPKRDDLLAVACHNKLLIWSLKSDMSSSRLRSPDSKQCLQVLNPMINSPLTSLVFSPDGDQLVVCSPRNSSLLLIRFQENLPPKIGLIRKPLILPQFTLLNWSPDKTRLLAHTTIGKLCIFESKKWSHKFWQLPLEENGRQLCQTSAWSRPSGRILLFVPKGSSKIYALTFYDRAEAGDVGGGPSDQSIMVLDTRQQQLFKSDSFEISIIHQICWDSKSTRLAVSFRNQLDTISIYRTQLNPGLQIQPLCVLKSAFAFAPQSRCLLLSFHDNYIDPGSLLTICWSNGYLTHIPLQNSNDSAITNNKSSPTSKLAESSIRSLTSLCTSFDESGLGLQNDNSLMMNRSSIISRSPFSNSNGTLNNGKNSTTKGLQQLTNQSHSNQLKMVSSPSCFTSNTPRHAILYSTRVKLD